MTTRIDGYPGTPVRVERTEASEAGERAQTPASQVTTDGIEVTEDAQFVNRAVQAAIQAPAIRPDKVEQAKQALADGTLGADAAKLADAIIDRMLDDQK